MVTRSGPWSRWVTAISCNSNSHFISSGISILQKHELEKKKKQQKVERKMSEVATKKSKKYFLYRTLAHLLTLVKWRIWSWHSCCLWEVPQSSLQLANTFVATNMSKINHDCNQHCVRFILIFIQLNHGAKNHEQLTRGNRIQDKSINLKTTNYPGRKCASRTT